MAVDEVLAITPASLLMSETRLLRVENMKHNAIVNKGFPQTPGSFVKLCPDVF